MKPVIDTITDEAQLAEICHRTLVDWPEARAAVLFGSRARGDYRPDSDWDVALILDGEAKLKPAGVFKEDLEVNQMHNVDAWVAGAETLKARAGDLGYLPCAIAVDGRVIAGHWNLPQPKEMRMKPENWLEEMNMVLVELNDLFGRYRNIGDRLTWPDCVAGCRKFIVNSSNAAEHLVKTMVTRRGQQPKHIHDIDKLVNRFAQAHPDQAELAQRMKSLNGDSHQDHVKGYPDEEFTPDDCVRAFMRIPLILDLLAYELESDSDGGAMKETVPILTRSILSILNEWKDNLSYEVVPNPDTDDIVRQTAMVILDGRDLVRQALMDFEDRLKALDLPMPAENGPEQ